jgi:hypothetical protein
MYSLICQTQPKWRIFPSNLCEHCAARAGAAISSWIYGFTPQGKFCREYYNIGTYVEISSLFVREEDILGAARATNAFLPYKSYSKKPVPKCAILDYMLNSAIILCQAKAQN